jgi:hypothetical protein
MDERLRGWIASRASFCVKVMHEQSTSTDLPGLHGRRRSAVVVNGTDVAVSSRNGHIRQEYQASFHY